MSQAVIFVCQFCAFSATQRDYQGQRGGEHLLRHLQRLHETWTLGSECKIVAAACLSACNRRCVIALSAPEKTTLMFGDLPALEIQPQDEQL
jgi:predicted metal-binding protein